MEVIRNKTGWIEVITGSMFSGKTEELIRRVHRVQFAKQKVQVFKPAIDDRYSVDNIVSHNKMEIPSFSVRDTKQINELLEDDTQVVAIDEVQFFGEDVVELASSLADSGKRVIVAGLDQDYRGLPFGPMPKFLSIAEYVTKNLAICVKCGNPANRTQRLVANKETVLIGETDSYEARCRACHKVE